ncbi:hypothetical protein GCM10010531_28120 [Blastococcus jejuensis]|uniref:Transmembrane protein (PGPGW) n=1 Tax=Blastococcus jejuensis TaxID=351224 RepID=A0ABP6PAP9_9ACTN
MNRSLGAAAIIIGAAFLLMGGLVLLVPEPSVGLGIAFLVIGFPTVALGIRSALTHRQPGPEAVPVRAAAPARPRDDRPKSKFRQILDALPYFSWMH